MKRYSKDEISKLEALAVIGWAICEKDMSKEALDKLDGFEIIMLHDEFDKWFKNVCSE